MTAPAGTPAPTGGDAAADRARLLGSELALVARDVGKCYHVYARPADRLRQVLLRRRYHTEKWALRDVSFEVPRGTAVGIVGRNGSGKSTLLQIVAGTLAPTTGRVLIGGRVLALLELGSGFNPEFTGRDNVFLYGALCGLSRADMEARFDAVAAFADIGVYLDQPLKTYSSGMAVRLAFAVVAHLDPEILIVDEALAVGDAVFQHKCMRHLGRLLDGGTTLLFVSHSLDVVKRLCRRALWLEQGRCLAWGDAAEVVERYLADVRMELAAAPAALEVAAGTPLPPLPPLDGLPACASPGPDPALVRCGTGVVREFVAPDGRHPALVLAGAGTWLGFRTAAGGLELVFGAHPSGGRALVVVDGRAQRVDLRAPAARVVRVPVAVAGDGAVLVGCEAEGEVWFLEGVVAGGPAGVALKRSAVFDRRAADGRYGTGDAVVTFVEVLGEDGVPVEEIEPGAAVVVRVHAEVRRPCSQLDVSFIVRDANGIDLFGTTAHERGLVIPGMAGAHIVDFAFRNRLKRGSYAVHVALVARDGPDMTPLDVVQLAAVYRVSFDPLQPIWYMFDEPVRVALASDATAPVDVRRHGS